jgi:hypothetical protein
MRAMPASKIGALGREAELVISDFRETVAKLALEKWGIQLSRHAVIETKSGKGYRLNPDVIIINMTELA